MSSGQSSPSIFAITLRELKILIDRRNRGTPPSDGWGTYEIDCPKCHTSLAVVALIGTLGFHCPLCSYEDSDFKWLTNSFIGGDLNYLNPVAFNKTDFITRG